MRKLSAFCVANLMEERKKKENAWDVTRMYFETVLSFYSCNLGLWWTFLFLNLGLLNIQKHPHLNYRTIYCCIQNTKGFVFTFINLKTICTFAAFVIWSKQELNSFVSIFQRQVFESKASLTTIADCVQLAKKNCAEVRIS